MKNQFTFYFDDLSIMHGAAVYAYGEAEITYRIRRKDPDVGIMDDYIDDIDVKSITVYPSHDGEARQEIDYQHWLYQLIENALHANGDLVNACQNDMD
jgi:hypothetical protein